MPKKLWGGRFENPQKEELFRFLSSENVQLDEKLLLYDIYGNMAHVCMLAKQKLVAKEEAGEILSALLEIKEKAESGKLKLDYTMEDVHTFVESEVTKITPHGSKMHLARSRNDQVCLDTRLYMRDAILEICTSLLKLENSLMQLSKKDCVFPAYTHTQVAQPISLSFWAHAHYQAFKRDMSRLMQLYIRVDQNPLGSGAVAGTDLPIDRKLTSKLLGFHSPTANPMDTVSNRGELEAELLSILYISMAHASRLAEDCILLASKRLLVLPDEFSTGSSMMPQKKNPDPFELVRGKASRILGLYIHAASLLKGLPSGYNLDSQESKYALMHGVESAIQSFEILSAILPYLKFDEEKIKLELEEGFACATDLANLLSKKGIPFRKAHEATGQIVKKCIAEKRFLSSISPLEVFDISGVKVSAQELAKALSVDKVERFSQYKLEEPRLCALFVKNAKKSISNALAALEKEARSMAGKS